MAGTVEIINLVDNTVTTRGLIAEHGLAFLVRTGERTILFDTGAGGAVVQNMLSLGLDPREITAIALSHGHDDHTGGLKKICEITGPLPVYAHPDVFTAKYRLREGEKARYIGIPWSRAELETSGAIFHLSRQPVELVGGVILTGEIRRRQAFEATSKEFRLLAGGEYLQDSLWDDQSLIITTREGPLVLLGCAHSGLISTLEHILDLTGASRIFAVIGGTHLKDAGPERLEETIKSLPRFGLQYLVACHCTGFRASASLYQALGDKFIYNEAGRAFRFAC
ncbi:Beta-lactamase-like [Moorella glycerini]|uniref:Ribonuclease Z n=1 Tax=Neomoorella stamsii TaxID=1266720 RepID=A0A9X7J0S9_9FIRM|nr:MULTISPECIES: MBL fold metallo-hydrolase [Moorella]PRR70358.1 ribonuclease Z [Moorella stamsii]CEP66363.1 Beta-lactamase-like [Moorella glycerini]